MQDSKWHVLPGPSGVGSRLIEARLRESLEKLEGRFRVEIPAHGRHREALNVLDLWNNSEAAIELSNVAELERIAEAQRVAWETYLIVVASLEDRRNPRTPFTRQRFQDLVLGPFLEDGRDATPRNTQFELYVAAMLRLNGLSVYDGEPDLHTVFGKEEVGVAVKRVRSLNPDQVQKNARDAARQIEKSAARGWIAMNLDSRFSSIDRTRSEAAVLPDFDSAFGAVAHALKRPSEKKHVLGFMLFGYAAAFVPGYRPGEPPRLLCSSPLRWYGVSDDPTDEQLFWQFTEGWLNRLPARMQTIADRGFTGLL